MMRWIFAFLVFTLTGGAQAASNCRAIFETGRDQALPSQDSAYIISHSDIQRTQLIGKLRLLRATREVIQLQKMDKTKVERQLVETKLALGAAMIRDSLLIAAREENVVIVIRPLKAASVVNLERSTVPKPLSLKVKTMATGSVGGLVPADPALSMPEASPQELQNLRESVAQGIAKRKYTVQNVAGFDVLADARGHLFSSDVDLATVLYQSATTGVRQEAQLVDDLGWVSMRDISVIKAINKIFKSIDVRSLKREIVQHGPWSAQPEAPPLDFPLTVFTPQGEIHVSASEEDYLAYLSMWRERGYR